MNSDFRKIPIAVIGLGLMGGSFARRLKELGHPVIGLNRTKKVAEEALAMGIVDSIDPKDLKNPYLGTDWLIPFNKLKVLDSPHDTRIGELEEEVLGLESDLVVARSCIAISEELREQQHDLIQKLVEEVDMLKAEVYHLRNLNS